MNFKFWIGGMLLLEKQAEDRRLKAKDGNKGVAFVFSFSLQAKPLRS
jgi:hypothetical protein